MVSLSKFDRIIFYLCDITETTEWEGNVYAVGGCVRDRLMGCKEIKDIDLVVTLPDGGIKFAEWLKDKGFVKGEVVTYPTYGTAMCHLKEFPDVQLELVQTRKEQYRDKNSRNPETAYGTLTEDAFRRDLTINALYYRISDNSICDPTDKGFMDLDKQVIRTTSDPSIVYSDDPLRILRAVRFSARFGWDIEPNTLKGMETMVDGLRIISAERIQTELSAILTGPNVRKALETMMDIGIMWYVIPELIPLVDLAQNSYHDATAWVHTLRVVDYMEKRGWNSLTLMMSALLHDIGKPDTLTVDKNDKRHFIGHERKSKDIARSVLKHLKYSNDFIDEVCFIIGEHMWSSFEIGNGQIFNIKDKNLRKFQLKCGSVERYREVMRLIDADKNSHKETVRVNLYGELMEMCQETIDRQADMFSYKLPVDGNDVMRIKHIGPGIEVKQYLDFLMKVVIGHGPRYDRPQLIKILKGCQLERNGYSK